MLRSALALSLMLALTGPALADTAETEITECDRLASHGYDADRVAPGVSSKTMDIGAAILACSDAVAADPGNPRLRYQLGRALHYAGQGALGIEHLRAASERGYPQAIFVIGYIYSIGEQVPLEPCRAAGLWRASAATGHFWSRVYLGEALLDGSLDGCFAAPTESDIRPMLDPAIEQAKTDPAYADGLEQAEALKAKFIEKYGDGA